MPFRSRIETAPAHTMTQDYVTLIDVVTRPLLLDPAASKGLIGEAPSSPAGPADH
jgi:hypothetical protein